MVPTLADPASGDAVRTAIVPVPGTVTELSQLRAESAETVPFGERGAYRRGMARPRRYEDPGGYYHVTTRGNDRQPIVLDDVDCGIWERTLAKAARRFGWQILAYCLMPNHFHLTLRIAEGGLSDGMCLLNGQYARQFNQRHDRSNHLFGRRFWSNLIDTNEYLICSARYSDWNPVRGRLSSDPSRYRWSSYGAIVGDRHAPSFLAVGDLLGLFSRDPAAARAAYRSHVASGQGSVPGTVTEPLRPTILATSRASA
jgi:REP element-mobilizing transposase RayT